MPKQPQADNATLPTAQAPSVDLIPSFQPTLHQRTWNALRQTIDSRNQTVREIATGSGVAFGWLRMYALKDRIPDPSVSRIEKLYHYLTGRTL